MTVKSNDQLSQDMRACASQLVQQAGLVPQSQDQPLGADDLLFYVSNTSMPMASFLSQHGLFMDDQGLHFDLAQFGAIKDIASKVITERQAGKLDGVWQQFDLSTDEDVDNDGTYILTALAALELLYGDKT